MRPEPQNDPYAPNIPNTAIFGQHQGSRDNLPFQASRPQYHGLPNVWFFTFHVLFQTGAGAPVCRSVPSLFGLSRRHTNRLELDTLVYGLYF